MLDTNRKKLPYAHSQLKHFKRITCRAAAVVFNIVTAMQGARYRGSIAE